MPKPRVPVTPSTKLRHNFEIDYVEGNHQYTDVFTINDDSTVTWQNKPTVLTMDECVRRDNICFAIRNFLKFNGGTVIVCKEESYQEE